jgi:hypothetical protein
MDLPICDGLRNDSFRGLSFNAPMSQSGRNPSLAKGSFRPTVAVATAPKAPFSRGKADSRPVGAVVGRNRPRWNGQRLPPGLEQLKELRSRIIMRIVKLRVVKRQSYLIEDDRDAGVEQIFG